MNPIEENAYKVLTVLVEPPLEELKGSFDGENLESITGLNPDDLSDAIDYLRDLGAIDVLVTMGTAPYRFRSVSPTARGKYLYHEMKEQSESEQQPQRLPERPINPVGSPYGFTDEDWEFVALKKKDFSTLYVVFGLQYDSKYYDTELLIITFRDYFLQAVEAYNEKNQDKPIKLVFEKLEGGYGEHLFNNIARQIIASDIAVFDSSERNANVMIELGVALTWGRRVLPIREASTSDLPNDISGQTWIKYKESGEEILDELFLEKLERMVERAIMKKGA